MKKYCKVVSLVLCLCLTLLLVSGCNPGDPDADISVDPPKNNFVETVEVQQLGPKVEVPSFAATADNSTDVQAHGAKADGTTDDAEAFRKAVSAVSGKGYLYFAAGTYRIGSHVEIPENVVLVINRGAYLSVDAGVTLTVKGFVEAGCYRVFKGEGNVVGSIRSAAYPHWFGEVTTSADDTAVMQTAINACNYILLPATNNYQLGTLHITKPTTITGTGSYETIINFDTGSDVLFSIESSNVSIMQMRLTKGKGEGATAILFDNSKQDLANITLYRLYNIYVGRMIDTASDAHDVTNVEIVKVIAEATAETGIHLVNFKKNILLDDTIVSDLFTIGTVDFPLFLFENCEGMRLDNTDAAGGAGKGKGADGFYFRGCKDVEVGRSMVDYANGFGLVLDNCSDFVLNYWINSLCEEGGTFITNSENIVFHVANNNGNLGGMENLPVIDGIDAAVAIENSKNISYVSLFVQQHYAHGIRITDSTDVVMKNVIITGMGGNGFVEEGTSNNNVIQGLTINGVNGVEFTQVGANTQTHALVIGSIHRDHITGPEVIDA